jgi:hypothetical protein
MSPKILEYEDGRIKITASAYLQPELKVLIDKFDTKVEPYLAFVYFLTATDSPYINLPEEEKEEAIIFDVVSTLGEFDYKEPLLKPAVDKLEYLNTSTTKRYYEALKSSIDKMSDYLRTTSIIEGRDGNLTEIIRIHKEGASTIRNFKDIEKQVDEELRVKTRGDVEIGEY